MVDALLAHIPNAKVGHLGVYRNEETFEPVYYYAKMPSNVVESKVLIVDPMLATGGSIIYTIDYLKSLGVKKYFYTINYSCTRGYTCYKR
ncbi:Uracil phosphoribosyltransferase [Streptobacillus moniliformis]|nr:Uracil phosphoribosyltransferase [Streptobacillus moniliformis]